MSGKILKTAGAICFGLCLLLGNPADTKAEEYRMTEIEKETTSYLVARIDALDTDIYKTSDAASELAGTAERGEAYEVVSAIDESWLEIRLGDETGYIKKSDATIVETAVEAVDEEVVRRKELVNYALQFVGGRYVYGGNDPNTGVDCSGFTRYVMEHGAGVELSRSSRAQATQGTEITSEEMRPGDLIFYGSKSRINHVAMYIGNGEIVHASTEKTGIKTSVWDYRTPVKIVSMLG